MPENELPPLTGETPLVFGVLIAGDIPQVPSINSCDFYYIFNQFHHVPGKAFSWLPTDSSCSRTSMKPVGKALNSVAGPRPLSLDSLRASQASHQGFSSSF